MWQRISVKREHPAEPMIPDVELPIDALHLWFHYNLF